MKFEIELKNMKNNQENEKVLIIINWLGREVLQLLQTLKGKEK